MRIPSALLAAVILLAAMSFFAAMSLFAAMSAAMAASGKGGLPTIDLQSRCKKSEAAVVDMMGDPSMKESAFDLCMRSEQAAREALEKAWPDIPANYRSFCVRTADYSASYVEWIACLEMMIDAKKQRTDSSAKFGDVPDRCPAIYYAEDGSIKRIVACTGTGRRR